MHPTASSSPKIAITFTMSIAARGRNWNRRSAHPTVLVSTVYSPTRRNATSSGTVGTERLPGTSVAPVSLTTVKPEFACGPIKYLNAKTKVNFFFLIYSIFIDEKKNFLRSIVPRLRISFIHRVARR